MCQPASFVLTKDRVFWSESTDSHSAIIEEYKLNEWGTHGPNIVKIEITPPDGDMTKPLTEWVCRVDQDTLPDWYDADKCEKRGRKSLAEWAARRIVREGNVVIEGKRRVFAFGSSHVLAKDSSHVEAWGSSRVEAWGSSRVEAVEGHATVRLYHKATAVAPGGAYAVCVDCRGDKAICITQDT